MTTWNYAGHTWRSWRFWWYHLVRWWFSMVTAWLLEIPQRLLGFARLKPGGHVFGPWEYPGHVSTRYSVWKNAYQGSKGTAQGRGGSSQNRKPESFVQPTAIFSVFLTDLCTKVWKKTQFFASLVTHISPLTSLSLFWSSCNFLQVRNLTTKLP